MNLSTPKSSPEIMTRIDTAVVLRNPDKPSSVSMANKLYKDLTRGDLRVANVYIEDTQELPENYNPLLENYDQTDKNAWLVVGGDGTFSQFANSRPKSPVMIVPGGYANDTYKMLYRAKTYENPGFILAHGEKSVIRPLEIKSYKSTDTNTSINKVLDELYSEYKLNSDDVINPDDTELAFSYWGIGLSGQVSNHLEQKDVRKNRDQLNTLKKFIYSSKIISKNIPEAPELEIIYPNESHIRHEVLFANGSRMAKVVRFGGVDILEDKAAMLELSKANHLSFLLLLGRSALTASNMQFNSRHQHTFGVRSSDSIYSQRDGEAKKHASGTVFQVGISDYELKVITAR